MPRSDSVAPLLASSGRGGFSTRFRIELTDEAGDRVAPVRATWRLEDPAAA